MLSDEERKAKERDRWRRRYSDPRKRAAIRLREKKRPPLNTKDRLNRNQQRRQAYQGNAAVRATKLLLNDAYRRRNWETIKAKIRARYAARIAIDPAYADRLRSNRRRSYRSGQRARERGLMEAMRAAVPATYPRHVRDDIIGEMCLAVAERRLKPEGIVAATPDFARAYWRTHSPFETISLDASLFSGGPTLGERLSHGIAEAEG